LADSAAEYQPGRFFQNLTLPLWQGRDWVQPHQRSYVMQVFSVEGMTCGHCVRAVTQAVQSKDSSASVKVDLAAKEVGVESRLSAEEVISLITEEGYSAKLA
jgi:copper chaperone